MEKAGSLIKGLLKSRLKTAIAILIVLAIGFLGYRLLGRSGQPLQYQTAKVEKGTITSAVSASGNVLVSNMISITTNATGVVNRVYVKDGDVVTKDQKIAQVTLDREGEQKSAQAWASYLSAKTGVDSANTSLHTLRADMFSKWKTYKDLAESSSYDSPETRSKPQFIIAQDEWLASEGKYKNQEAVIEQAKASQNSAWVSYQLVAPLITAPVSGTVTNIGLVEDMVLSSPSQRIAVIQNQADPLIRVNLAEIDVPRVKVGQKTTVTLDSVPDKTFAGEVVTVDTIGVSESGVTNYPSIIRLHTPSLTILPNMAASVVIAIDKKDNALMVPSGAIQSQGERSFVRKLQEMRQERIPVKTGISSDTHTEIISGLREGDEIIIGIASGGVGSGGRSVFGGGGVFRPPGLPGGRQR